MKARNPIFETIERASFRASAYVVSRLLSRDIETELDRLDRHPKFRSYLEVSLILAVLFGMALLGASFGPWGLLIYFAVILVVFR